MGAIKDIISLETGGKFSEIVDSLLPDDIRQTTDLSESQVNHLAYLHSMCSRFGLPRIANLCDEFLHLRVSVNRGSRGEFTDVFRYLERRPDFDGDGDAAEIDSITETKK